MVKQVPRTKGTRAYRHRGPRPAMDRPALEIEDLFWSHDGFMLNKWHHYLPIYDRYFGPFRGRPVRMLEIGVWRGGSMDLWRKYFGPDAIIYGVDIEPSCAAFNGISGQIRIGSQDDPEFLAKVVEEMGGVDLILDDGSHVSAHIQASLKALYPLLSNGGIYMIEDLHAAYWEEYGGGYRAPTSFLEDVKVMIDDLNHWYHYEGEKIEATRGALKGLHVYDSVVVLEKDAISPPKHSKVGHR